jgi:protein-histidine N-methyltransferase
LLSKHKLDSSPTVSLTNFISQLASLPDHLCYSTIQIESPTGKTIDIPRRDLSDIRVQLMAEDEAANDETLKDLHKSDIRTGVYEGGFKTWECSVDLASILLDRGPRKDIDELVRCDQIVEVSLPLSANSPSLHHTKD